MSTPAEDFAAFLNGGTADAAPADTGPRVPAPNPAQGTSSVGPAAPDPVEAFADLLRVTLQSRRGDGGWR